MEQVQVNIPEHFQPLAIGEQRYKMYYGGRSGGKSYGFADVLLLLCREKKLFVACVREVQDSIKDSVYKLLKDRANHYGFEDFEFYTDRIDNKVTKSRIIFKGLRDENSQTIKSLEGVDICWIEEGQAITKKSWEVLNPTIRKPKAQIWVSMNREEENDPIFAYISKQSKEDAVIKRINYYDNPFCPKEMHRLAEFCKKDDYDEYLHVWLGEPRQVGDTKLISVKVVKEAMATYLDPLDNRSPLIIGVDVARFGDDSTVFAYRKGRQAFKMDCYRKLDTVELANIIHAKVKQMNPAKVFVDIGASGAGVFDILVDRGLGKVVKGINFGSKAILNDRYINKRAEMWGELNEWLKGGNVQLPKDEELVSELCAVGKKYDGMGRLGLESKEDVKARLMRSPDRADALCLTFAEPVFDIDEKKEHKLNILEQCFRDDAKQNRSNDSW